MSDKWILTVVHQATSIHGKMGDALASRGYLLDRRCPYEGEGLPSSLEGYDGVVVFGGPQSANDDHEDGIRRELDWLERVGLPSEKPLLGICLGAQLMARVLGARVGLHDEGTVEIGYHEVKPTAEAGEFLPESRYFYQWHKETFGIPNGAVHLAHNEVFAGQAFRYGRNAFAIEFHPEMTIDMIDNWCMSDDGSKKLDQNGAQSYLEQRRGYASYAKGSDDWLNQFVDGWLRTDGETS